MEGRPGGSHSTFIIWNSVPDGIVIHRKSELPLRWVYGKILGFSKVLFSGNYLINKLIKNTFLYVSWNLLKIQCFYKLCSTVKNPLINLWTSVRPGHLKVLLPKTKNKTPITVSPLLRFYIIYFWDCSLIAFQFEMIFLINTQNRNSIKAPAMDVAYQAAWRPREMAILECEREGISLFYFGACFLYNFFLMYFFFLVTTWRNLWHHDSLYRATKNTSHGVRWLI